MSSIVLLASALFAPSCERGTSAWLEDLERGSIYEQRLAVVALREAEDEHLNRAFRTLVDTLEDRDLEKRKLARESIIFLGPRVVPRLMALLASPEVHNLFVLKTCSEGLMRAPEDAVDPLLELLFSGFPGAVERAAPVLVAIGGPAVAGLEARLVDDETATRTVAARTLGRVGPEAAPVIDRLLEAYVGEELEVRNAILWAVPRIAPEDPRARRIVDEALHSRQPLLRATAEKIRNASTVEQ